MSFSKSTLVQSAEFVLLCFPGEWSWWKDLFFALFLIMLIAASTANMTLIWVIHSEQRLHNPMYYLICFLSLLDLTVCWLVTIPFLISLWCSSMVITPSSCFAETYFTSTLMAIESGVFMVMSYDRYHAICNPLHYPLMIANNSLLKVLVAVVGRSSISGVPLVVLTAQLNYCNETVIPQCFCETLSVSSLACEPNPVIGLYCFISMWFTTAFDLAFIVFSYFMILRAVLQVRSQGAFTKAFSTCSSHLILVVYFYSSVILLVIAGAMKDTILNDVYNLMALFFCLIPPLLNPLVYGLRTKEIREKIIWTSQKTILTRNNAKVGF